MTRRCRTLGKRGHKRGIQDGGCSEEATSVEAVFIYLFITSKVFMDSRFLPNSFGGIHGGCTWRGLISLP